jgi:hypothetical protein
MGPAAGTHLLDSLGPVGISLLSPGRGGLSNRSSDAPVESAPALMRFPRAFAKQNCRRFHFPPRSHTWLRKRAPIGRADPATISILLVSVCVPSRPSGFSRPGSLMIAFALKQVDMLMNLNTSRYHPFTPGARSPVSPACASKHSADLQQLLMYFGGGRRKVSACCLICAATSSDPRAASSAFRTRSLWN